MKGVKRPVQCLCQRFINLVPCHGLIAGNMVGIAYGMGIAHQAHIPPWQNSAEWVSVHREVPSPGMITGFPSSIRFNICQFPFF